MIRLRTSPNDIMRWLGIGPLRRRKGLVDIRSDNLRLPSPEKARHARALLEGVESGRIATVNATAPWIDGGDDAA